MSDWGKGAINNKVGWGQGANNGIGWGNVQLTSWGGDTNVSGKEDTKILSIYPEIWIDGRLGYDSMFLRFELAEGVQPMDMSFDVYLEGEFLGTIFVSNGISEIIPFPRNGSYYGILNVVVDRVDYAFQSNTINY